MTEKVIPFSLEAEQATLGSLLIDGTLHESEVWPKVRALVSAKDFYDDRNYRVFEAIDELRHIGMGIDEVTVAVQICLKSRTLDMSNHKVFAYLKELIEILPTSIHAEFYARIVKRLSLSRQQIQQGERIKAQGYSLQARGGGYDIETTQS